jgi:PEP-CTERM motif
LSLGFDLFGAPVAAPEPGSMLLLGTGVASLTALIRCQRRATDHPGR